VVKLNTPGQSNGWLKGWFDGTLAYENTAFSWRNSTSLKMDHVAYETFFGGCTANYASPQTQYTYWDNVVLGTGPIGPPA
jgi:hypothetical protein